MADLIRYLRDREVIAPEHGGWVLARALPALDSELPESVRGMIERKIAQLTEEDRRLLVAASVQGYQFDSVVVARALGAGEAEVEEQLEALERVHAFVRFVTDEELPDRTLTLRYRFVHVLYQGVLYSTLRPTRRAALSKAVADAFAGCYGDQRDKVAPALASLFEASRDFAQAADYFLLAAQNATRIFANHEAIALARRGLEGDQGAGYARPRAAGACVAAHARLAVGQRQRLCRAGGGADLYARARAVRAGGRDRPDVSGALGLAMCHLNRGNHSRTRELGTDILRLAQETSNPAALVTAHYMLGTVLVYLGDITAAREHYAQGIAPSDAHPELTLADGRDPGISCRAQLGRVLWLLGYPEQALEVSEAAQRAAQEGAHPHDLVFAFFLDMLLRQFGREIAQTQQRAEHLRALADEHSLPQYRAWGHILHGWARAPSEGAAGIAEMRESLAAYERLGIELSRPHFLALLAEAVGNDGRGEEAVLIVDDALASTERTHERYYEAELHRLKGELLLKSPQANARPEAEACFHRALEVARRQQAKSLELRAATSLARLWLQEGRSTKAHAALAAIYNWFTEGFERPDLRDAKALLEVTARVRSN